MELIVEKDADRHQYNLSVSNEVAIIIQDEYSQPCKCKIVLIECNNNQMFQISPTYTMYMPLHYVLLFPYRDLSWHWGLQPLD